MDNGRDKCIQKGSNLSRVLTIFLLVFSLTSSIVAIEIYFRLTSPHIVRKETVGLKGVSVASGDYGFFMDSFSGRRLIPNSHVICVYNNGNRVMIDINSLGFRGEELPEQKNPDEMRVLVLGDSITFGVYVPEEATYVRQAESHLNLSRHAKRIRLINGGVEGIGTKDEIDILESQGVRITPDIVVVGFYLNDANPPDRLAYGLANPGFVRRHSVLAQTIYLSYILRQYRYGNRAEEEDMYGWLDNPPPYDLKTNRNALLQYAKSARRDWGVAWEPDSWGLIDEQLDRLKKLSNKYQFSVLLLAFPSAFQVDAEYLEDGPQQRLKGLVGKYNFDYLDLLPVLRSQAKNGPLFSDHCHLEKSGHDIVGKTLAFYLSEKMLGGQM